MLNLKFPGRGQRETPVGDIYAVVELIMLLPGRRAGLVRSYEPSRNTSLVRTFAFYDLHWQPPSAFPGGGEGAA